MNQHTFKKTALKTGMGVLLAVFLFFSQGIQIPLLDATADSYFKDSITKASLSYGICRVINATVSVIKESSLELEPAGVGLSIAVGQLVDPINDMVERLSNVLVISMSSLAVQELAYEISKTLIPPIFTVSLLLFSLLLWLKNHRIIKLQMILINVMVLVAVARFCLPISSFANQFLQERFFENRILEANEAIAASTADLETLKETQLPKFEGILGTMESSASYLKQKSVDLKNALTITIEKKALIIENLLKLTFLYLGIFIIQVLVLPLLTFWFLMKILNSLFFTTTMIATSQHHSATKIL